MIKLIRKALLRRRFKTTGLFRLFQCVDGFNNYVPQDRSERRRFLTDRDTCDKVNLIFKRRMVMCDDKKEWFIGYQESADGTKHLRVYHAYYTGEGYLRDISSGYTDVDSSVHLMNEVIIEEFAKMFPDLYKGGSFEERNFKSLETV
ncbi:hypothetical protein VPHK469_0179 [Vibrio phage K469]